MRATPLQYGGVHCPHAARSEEFVKKGDEPFQAVAVGVREAQQKVDVVEPVADFVARSLRARQSDFSRVALFHQLPELGAGVRGAQLRGVRHLPGQHRFPSVCETVKDLSSLRGQLLDASLEVGGLLVDELLQVLDGLAERRFHQDATGEH